MLRRGIASALLAWASLAAGCRVTDDYVEPELALGADFSGPHATRSGPRSSEEVEWWQEFQDPILTRLILGGGDNLDFQIARARLQEARAIYDRTRGGIGPQLNANAGYAWRESSTNLGMGPFADSNPTELYQAGFDASWELDLFGRNARAIEAARAGVDAAYLGTLDAEVTIVAEIGRSYVELRAAQQAIDLTRANLEAQEETLELVRVRARAELASDLDVARAEGQAATTRALLPQLEMRQSEALHRLAVLQGNSPSDRDGALATRAAIPKAPILIHTGTPADLIRRRPDVRRAERELARAAALSAQATAELFPSISLTAAIGLQANTFAKLLDGDSTTFSVGPSLTAPIFHSGALRANVRAQGARQQQAMDAYELAALNALREVEDALVGVDRERVRMNSLGAAVVAGQRALELARLLNREGLADFFDVLDAQRTVLAAQLALSESEARHCTAAIALYKASGVGWRKWGP